MGVGSQYSWTFGTLPKGPRNLITDVPGLAVGHCTLRQGSIQTGVTAILPHPGNCFQSKCVAAAHVINGFGKSVGLIQIQELGTLETPILLTNTLSVGTVSTALIRYMLADNPDIGVTTGTVNPVVLECNDGRLNDIRGLHVEQDHVFRALHSANPAFEEGAVGAGTGMCCYGLKGGIGSSSRRVTVEDSSYTLGTLVLSNFGALSDLVISGQAIGRDLAGAQERAEDKGSVIVVIATDLPLSARQLARVSRRAQNGIARTGTITGNGSGEIVLSFSTANQVPHYPSGPICSAAYLHEDYMDRVFRAAVESVEESVVSSLVHAETDPDTEIHSLSEYIGGGA